MKSIVIFFKKDQVQIVMIAICMFVMIRGFVTTFVVTAFPMGPEREKLIQELEEEREQRAKWYREMKEKMVIEHPRHGCWNDGNLGVHAVNLETIGFQSSCSELCTSGFKIHCMNFENHWYEGN